MRIKLNNSKQKSEIDMEALWKNSPCCLNYLVSNTSTDRSRRFQVGSIYYKDQVNKPKKVFNEFEKPDMLRNQFVRLIEEASHPKYYRASKKNNDQQTKIKKRTLSMASTATNKLYTVPMKNQYQYDRGGFRSHAFGDYNVKEIENKVLQSKRNFSSGRRVDLGRPLNFFPGPGTYDPERNQEDSNKLPLTMRTCISFRKNGREQHPSERQKSIKQ